MKLYSMTLANQPKNHTKRAEWEMDRDWNITKSSQLERVIKILRGQTKFDKVARILCTVPATKLEFQERLYTVKFGHDGLIFDSKTQLYDDIASKLQQRGKP
jgi:hypothetical protein